jgi:putative sterol carrier protein
MFWPYDAAAALPSGRACGSEPSSSIESKDPDMDLQACTEALRAKVGDNSGLNAVLKFDCGADGVVVIDGKSSPNTVSNDNVEADCTVAITRENLAAMLAGTLDPVTGFMSGKFKVSGDMSVAMKLQRVVG